MHTHGKPWEREGRKKDKAIARPLTITRLGPRLFLLRFSEAVGLATNGPKPARRTTTRPIS